MPSPHAAKTCVPGAWPWLTVTPTNPAYQADETFAFISSETGSTFECQLDSAVPAPCASPDTVTLTSGSHVFKVAAIDKYGNKGGAASFGWLVDLTAPQVQILSPRRDARGRGRARIFLLVAAGQF